MFINALLFWLAKTAAEILIGIFFIIIFALIIYYVTKK